MSKEEIYGACTLPDDNECDFKEDKKRKYLTVKPEIHKRILEIAKSKGMWIETITNKILQSYLDWLDNKEEKDDTVV